MVFVSVIVNFLLQSFFFLQSVYATYWAQMLQLVPVTATLDNVRVCQMLLAYPVMNVNQTIGRLLVGKAVRLVIVTPQVLMKLSAIR